MRRWPWLAWKIRKRRFRIPNSCNRKYFITSAIDEHDRRDVATIGITGEFLHADSDDHIIMELKGKLNLLMFHVDTKLYRK